MKNKTFLYIRILLLWFVIVLTISILYNLIAHHEVNFVPSLRSKTPPQTSVSIREPIISTINVVDNTKSQSSNTDSQYNSDWGLSPKSRFAYVTLLHGIDESLSYRGFLFNCILMKTSLEKLGSTADFLALVGFTQGNQPNHPVVAADLALLKKHGIQIVILPRLLSDKVISQTKQNKVQFHEMALLKVLPWSFTQYEKIQYMDGDVLPHTNMDCLFRLPTNTFNTGTASPLNSGWYLAVPNRQDYEVLRKKAEWRLILNRWDDTKGWGTPIPFDHLKYRGQSRPVKKWEFNGASLDQGLLTHYFVLNNGRIVLLDEDVALQYTEHFTSKTLSLESVLDCCKGRKPVDLFYHYTGQNKPWLKNLKKPKDTPLKYWIKVLDEAKLDINSSNIAPKQFRSPLGYFYPNK